MSAPGMHIAAAAWIKPLPEGRGEDMLDAGCKVVLQAYWDHTKWGLTANTEGDNSPNASYATIALEIGSKAATVEDRTRKLIAAGWAERDESGRLRLAWAVPFARVGPLVSMLPRPDSSQSNARPKSEAAAVNPTDPSQPPHRPESATPPTRVSHPTDPSQDKLRSSSSERSDEPIIPPRSDGLANPGPRRRRSRGDLFQPSLPIPDTDPAPEATHDIDPVQLVAERLRQRQAEVRSALSMSKPGQSVLDAKRRSKINACIDGYGLEACYRVIDVDAAECQAQGPDGKSWAYWNLDTPFRDAANFERRLNRWREDGNHEVWGVPKNANTSPPEVFTPPPKLSYYSGEMDRR